MSSENLDRAERALDEGLELAAAPAYREFGLGASVLWCWRCGGSPSETDIGLCGSCHAAMLDESTTAPEPRPWSAVVGALPTEQQRRYDEAMARWPRLRRLRARLRRRWLASWCGRSEPVESEWASAWVLAVGDDGRWCLRRADESDRGEQR